MVKRRIIPIELYRDGRLVKSVKFGSWRDVGDPVRSSRVYSDQDADELLFLNISRESRSVKSLAAVVREISRSCYVPLSVGGGINSMNDAEILFEAGADKVVICSLPFVDLDLISRISSVFGIQAVIVCIDVRRLSYNHYQIYSNCGSIPQNVGLLDYVSDVQKAGAGEIMIQSIDLDGTMDGYDLDLLSIVLKQTQRPVIIAGGAGNFLDLKKALDLGADAVACGSLFNFGDNNPIRAKAYLKNYNIQLKTM